MKYQEFEKYLKIKALQKEEYVDTTALIEELHKQKDKKVKGLLLWLIFSSTFLVVIFSGMLFFSKTSSAIGKGTKEKKESISSNTQDYLDFKTATRSFANEKPLPASPYLKDELLFPNTKPILTQSAIENVRYNRNQNLDHSSVHHLRGEKIETFLHSEIINHSSFNQEDLKRLDDENRLIHEFTKSRSFQELQKIQTLTPPLIYNKERDPELAICPTFKKQGYVIDILPEIGIILPFKSLVNSSGEESEVFSLRSKDEVSLEGMMSALNLRIRPVQKPLFVKFGVSYTRISERMKLNTTWIERDTTVGIISITESQNGDTLTTIYGDVVTETEHFRISSDHYYLHLIDLPISFGYSTPLGNGWRLGAEMGVQFNLALSTTGKLLEGTGANSYTNLPAGGRFKTRLGMSYHTGLNLEKTLAPRSSIYFSARVRFFSNSFTTETYAIDQRYLLAGLHMGYIYTIR